MQQRGLLQHPFLPQSLINLRHIVPFLHWRRDSFSLKQQRSFQPQAASMADASGTERSRQLLSVAPMMDWTDIHYRQLARLISRHTWLYTEMVVDMTILHSPHTDKHLYFPPEQHPIVCQLGGSNPEKLAAAARVAAGYGYDEINLNCGCPSDRVAGAGCFGASLMLQPEAVGDGCRAMAEATGTEVTVKCRLGVDDVDSYEELCHFITTVAERSSVRHFIMHARKCLLSGLSPAQNRTVPPLRREWVWALKRDFPELEFSLNGVVQDCHEAAAALQHEEAGARLHGVMIGRAAYHGPWASLGNADRAVFGAAANAAANRREVLARYGEYGDSILGRFGVKDDGHKIPNVRAVIKPLIGLFYSEPGGRRWRNAIDRVLLQKPATVSEVIQEAMKAIPDHVLDAAPPQLDALPAFSLPQPLPPGHSTLAHAGSCTGTLAHAGTGVSSPGAAVLPDLSADSGPKSGEQNREHQHVAPFETSEQVADSREASAAPQHAKHAAVLCMSSGGGEGIAETKRLRLDSSTAGDVPLAGANQDQSRVARDSAQQPDQAHESRPGQEQGLQHAEDTGGGIDLTQCLDQHSEQAEKHHPYLDKGRLLVSA